MNSTISKHKASGKPIEKRKQAERTLEARAKIIEAALVCLARSGYHKTSLTDIAIEAGCSRELPRYHFESREGLMAALLEDARDFWVDMFHALEEINLTGYDAICEIINIYTRLFKTNSVRLRGQIVLIFGVSDPGSVPVLKKKLKDSQTLIEEAFKDLIKHEFPEQGKKHEKEIDAVASFIYIIIRGIVYKWIMYPEKIEDILQDMEKFKNVIRNLLPT